jgi:hypothetical protein
LQENCWWLATKYGLERIGFLTLTFAEHVVSYKTGQKYLHSLMTGVLRERYPEYIIVMERMASGRVHYHLLVVVAEDIRVGFDFAAVTRGNYDSASAYLKQEWKFWRDTAPKYGFGRTELLPIRKSAAGIAKYLGKYVAKHIGNRLPEDKGARLVRYSKGTNRVSTRFFWHTTGADLWRLKLGALCRKLGLTSDNYAETFQKWFGKNWIQTLGPIIESIRLSMYPSFPAMQLDYPSLEMVPHEVYSQPEYDPFGGPLPSPHPEQAQKTLQAAWIVALDERERSGKRPKKWSGFKATTPLPLAVSEPPKEWASWIERTLKED